MKAVLASTCFLEGNDGLGNNRFERTRRYLAWYTQLKDVLGFESIVLFDNASSHELCDRLENEFDVDVIRYAQRLESAPGKLYPYCWRALKDLSMLINLGFEKLILIDTDGFIVSERMARHVRSCNSGWEAFWVPRYQFPTAEFHILNKDAFPIYREYIAHRLDETRLMETVLPFTRVNKDFVTDRFGEEDVPQTPLMDFYAQARLTRDLYYSSSSNWG